MSTRKDQFDKEYPKTIIPPQMMAVSVTLNFKSGAHDLTAEETPIYLTTPNMLPALVNQYLKVRLAELAKELPQRKKKKVKTDVVPKEEEEEKA